MRILIVGGGVAGLTLTALLKQRGLEPMVLERAANFDHAGYMMSLYPIGNRVLHGLNIFDKFTKISKTQNYYNVCSGRGKRINRYHLSDFLEKEFGSTQMLLRSDLLKLLKNTAKPKHLLMNTGIKSLRQKKDEVEVILSNGKEHSFDLVVGADGMHSQVRDFIFRKDEGVHHLDTGWGGWLWFCEDRKYPHNEITEFWGNGFCLGVYPIKGKLGIIVAMPNHKACLDGAHKGRRQMLKKICEGIGDALPHNVISAIPEDHEEMFYWRLQDVRCKEWSKGRVVLLGDAATGFLPTAGIGASMAMESAAVLNDELSRVDARYVETALKFYTQRRKARVEKAQTCSRLMARQMFVNSALRSSLRNFILKSYSLERLSKDLTKLFDQPI
jgi:2-polyprenyl-6-methoxyphenol hydroxylase-like FAD-dependent oxidoreductase